MIEKLAEQAAMALGQQLAHQFISDPVGAVEGLSAMAEALFTPPHHTAGDVAQDAIDAWENGELSDQAAMQIVAVVIGDKAKHRTVTVKSC